MPIAECLIFGDRVSIGLNPQAPTGTPTNLEAGGGCRLRKFVFGAKQNSSWSKAKKMPYYEAGDDIKVDFSDEAAGIGEWMWVRHAF